MARRPPIPIPVQVSVLFRDGWLCHLCRRPVVFHLALKRLQAFTDARVPNVDLAYWQANWRRDAAPLLDELAASVDHVLPFSEGGASDASNLAAVCARCNARKSARSDEEFLKQLNRWQVRGKHGEPTTWDGLCAAFVALAHENLEDLTATEQEWLAAIEAQLGEPAA